MEKSMKKNIYLCVCVLYMYIKHFAIRQKLTQHSKSTMLQLKKKQAHDLPLCCWPVNCQTWTQESSSRCTPRPHLPSVCNRWPPSRWRSRLQGWPPHQCSRHCPARWALKEAEKTEAKIHVTVALSLWAQSLAHLSTSDVHKNRNFP